MGIHFSDQARITDDRTALAELIVKEYLTFPVLLSEKEFPKVTHIVSPRKIHFVVDYSLKLYALFVKFFFVCYFVLVKWRRSALLRVQRF